MLHEWRRLPSAFTFLAAWFLLSDAFSTLTSTAILFAKTTLQLPTSSLIIIAALTPSAGIVGAILFPRLQRTTFPWSNLQMLVLLVSLATLVPVWGLLALRSAWQIYVLAVVFGAIYGSFQACVSRLFLTAFVLQLTVPLVLPCAPDSTSAFSFLPRRSLVDPLRRPHDLQRVDPTVSVS